MENQDNLPTNTQNNLTVGTKNNLPIDEVLKKFKRFKKKDIDFLIKKKIISYPITVNDLYILELFHRVWKTHEFIRLNLSGLGRRRRSEILSQCLAECNSKLDVWIYSRIKNKKELGQRIYTNQIVADAVRIFKLKKDKKTIEYIKAQIKKVNQRLRDQKRLRTKNKSLH
jgi:hypothetical protein